MKYVFSSVLVLVGVLILAYVFSTPGDQTPMALLGGMLIGWGATLPLVIK